VSQDSLKAPFLRLVLPDGDAGISAHLDFFPHLGLLGAGIREKE
jgi:hypothetical protein